jgi:hypothetical protein
MNMALITFDTCESDFALFTIFKFDEMGNFNVQSRRVALQVFHRRIIFTS